MSAQCLLCSEAFEPKDNPVAIEIRACSGPYAGCPGYLCGPECIGLFVEDLAEDSACDVIADAFEAVKELEKIQQEDDVS